MNPKPGKLEIQQLHGEIQDRLKTIRSNYDFPTFDELMEQANKLKFEDSEESDENFQKGYQEFEKQFEGLLDSKAMEFFENIPNEKNTNQSETKEAKQKDTIKNDRIKRKSKKLKKS